MSIEFRYFTGQEADMFSFYRVPKLLITSEYFKSISCEAKLLYGMALDRMSLSLKNHWLDNENRAYIYFSIDDIAELLGCGKNKAVKALRELETVGLIEKKRQGMGKSNVLYLKNFVIENEIQNVKKQTSIASCVPKNVTFEDSRIPENNILEVCKEGSNKNKYNKTYSSDNESNLIDSMDEKGKMDALAETIRQNLELEHMLSSYPYEAEIIQGIYELVLETMLCSSARMLVASNWYATSLVQSKFMKLTSAHVEYVLEGLQHNTSKVRNIKKYLLAALFNAPSTIGGYYRAEVNHNMYGTGS